MLHWLAWPFSFRLIVVLAAFSAAFPAMSAENDVYTVRDVVVDAQAADELSAKSAGIAGAQHSALRILLERITLRDDFDRLPEVATEALSQLVRNYAIDAEKFGGGRYLARLTVRFKPNGVRALLGDAGIPFAATVSRPVLVLPVFQNAGAISLWDEPNPWFAAWSRLSLRDSLLPLTLPVGDLSDVVVIGAEQAVRGVKARLAKIAAKYDTRGVLVMAATLRADPGGGALLLTVTSASFGGDRKEWTRVRKFRIAAGDSLDTMFRDAARAVADEALESWKQANLLDQESGRRMRVSIPLRSLKGWLNIRSRMRKIAGVKRIDMSQLSIDWAEVEVFYFGQPDQLRLAMAQSGLALKYLPESAIWILQIVKRK